MERCRSLVALLRATLLLLLSCNVDGSEPLEADALFSLHRVSLTSASEIIKIEYALIELPGSVWTDMQLSCPGNQTWSVSKSNLCAHCQAPFHRLFASIDCVRTTSMCGSLFKLIALDSSVVSLPSSSSAPIFVLPLYHSKYGVSVKQSLLSNCTFRLTNESSESDGQLQLLRLSPRVEESVAGWRRSVTNFSKEFASIAAQHISDTHHTLALGVEGTSSSSSSTSASSSASSASVGTKERRSDRIRKPKILPRETVRIVKRTHKTGSRPLKTKSGKPSATVNRSRNVTDSLKTVKPQTKSNTKTTKQKTIKTQTQTQARKNGTPQAANTMEKPKMRKNSTLETTRRSENKTTVSQRYNASRSIAIDVLVEASTELTRRLPPVAIELLDRKNETGIGKNGTDTRPMEKSHVHRKLSLRAQRKLVEKKIKKVEATLSNTSLWNTTKEHVVKAFRHIWRLSQKKRERQLSEMEQRVNGSAETLENLQENKDDQDLEGFDAIDWQKETELSPEVTQHVISFLQMGAETSATATATAKAKIRHKVKADTSMTTEMYTQAKTIMSMLVQTHDKLTAAMKAGVRSKEIFAIVVAPIINNLPNIVVGAITGVALGPLTDICGDFLGDFLLEPLLKPAVTQVTARVEEMVLVTVTEQGIPELAHLLHAEMEDQLKKTVPWAVVRSATRSLTTTLTSELSHELIKTLMSILSKSLVMNPTKALADTLTKTLTHTLALTLTHSLRHSPKADYMCYYCKKSKVYCRECHESMVQDYYLDYYAGYYAEYYSTYYANAYSGFWGESFVNEVTGGK